MHSFSYAWSLLVASRSWQSHISIRYSWKPHAAFRLHGCMFYRTRVIADQSLLCGNRDFLHFFISMALIFNRWLSYTNLTPIPSRYIWCAKVNFLRQGFQKLSSDRQTDTTEIICHVALFVVSNNYYINYGQVFWLVRPVHLHRVTVETQGPVNNMNWLAILADVLLGYLAMIMKALQQFTSVLLHDSY